MRKIYEALLLKQWSNLLLYHFVSYLRFQNTWNSSVNIISDEADSFLYKADTQSDEADSFSYETDTLSDEADSFLYEADTLSELSRKIELRIKGFLANSIYKRNSLAARFSLCKILKVFFLSFPLILLA